MIRFVPEVSGLTLSRHLKMYLLCIVEHVLWTQAFPLHHLISDGSRCDRINQINHWEAAADRFVLKALIC